MPLQDTDALIIEVGTAAESLPDPTTVTNRTHYISNTGAAASVISSVGATPFTENGVNVATISIARGEMKWLHSDGVHWLVVAFSGNLQLPTVTTPVRAFNTDFIPNASRPTLCLYTVSISGITTLLAGDDGRVELRADSGVAATVRASVRNRMVQTLGVTVGTQNIQEAELVFLAPAGWHINIATVVLAGAPTFTLVTQTETTL